jgi:hypothetical protein
MLVAILGESATRNKLVYIPDPVGVDVTGSRPAVAFSPDGNLVATPMGWNGYLWRWHSEDLIAESFVNVRFVLLWSL